MNLLKLKKKKIKDRGFSKNNSGKLFFSEKKVWIKD